MHLSITVKLLFSLLLGTVIGLEREAYEKRVDRTSRSGVGSLGIRSYALITTLGTIAAFFLKPYFSLFLIISITFSLLLITYYVIGSLFTKDNGMTTELAILWSYLIGVFVGLEALPMQLIIAITVILILILSMKEKIKLFIAGIKGYELEALISYAIIALIILPFLPDVSYTVKEIPLLSDILKFIGIDLSKISSFELINPYSVWKVVAIITGVEIFGYVLEKAVGQKNGWLLTSFIGGFISSTSTTQSLAQQSKTAKNIDRLTAAAIFTNLSSFFQHFILLASINVVFLIKNIPYIFSLSFSALIIGLYFLRKKSVNKININQAKEKLKQDKIFSLAPALQFAAIFLMIKIITKLCLVLFGNSGFIVSNILGALTGLDAVTINIAELAGKSITYQTGVLSLILANAVNLLSKASYVFLQGNRKFAMRFFISVIIMIVASFLGLIPLF